VILAFCVEYCLFLLLQDERDGGEAREATDADDGTGSSSDEDDQSAASKSAEHTRVRPSAPPSKPFDAQLTRRIPAWCRGELKTGNGKTSILQVKSSTSSRVSEFVVQVDRDNSYETAMVVVELHDACKEWVVPGQVVVLQQQGINAVVKEVNLPMKCFAKTSTTGFLKAGHVLLTKLSTDDESNLKKLKFKKGVLFALDGKSAENPRQCAGKNGSFYCDTSVLLRPSQSVPSDVE